jgi:hypothetical protein
MKTRPRGALSRRFFSYNALYKALGHAAVPNSGAHATLLLETFLENDGRLLASTVYARGLCNEKEFREWRKNLIDKGWLVWNETQQDKGLYFPGKKLSPYVNKEILAQKEIATRDSVEKVKAEKADRSELEETKKKLEATSSKLEATSSKLEATSSKLEATSRALSEITESVRELQEALIPPDTPEKKRARERAMDRIAARTAAN